MTWRGLRGPATGLLAVALMGAPAAAWGHTLSVRDEGKLRYVSSRGTWLTDEGSTTGTLKGKVRVSVEYNGSPTVRASFTIYGSGGSIRGRATCRLSNPNSFTPSFRGSLTISGGSGRYAHAHGQGELFGVFYRRGYGLTVQAIGKLRY